MMLLFILRNWKFRFVPFRMLCATFRVCVFVCAQNQMQHIFNKEFKHLRTSNQTCRLPLSGCVVLRFGLALKRSLNVLIPFIWHTIAINCVPAMQHRKNTKRQTDKWKTEWQQVQKKKENDTHQPNHTDCARKMTITVTILLIMMIIWIMIWRARVSSCIYV